MTEWTIQNKRGQKHYIVASTLAPLISVEPDKLQVNVIRVAINGGRPIKIIKEFDSTILFSEAIKRIATICELDDEIFNMVSESQSS